MEAEGKLLSRFILFRCTSIVSNWTPDCEALQFLLLATDAEDFLDPDSDIDDEMEEMETLDNPDETESISELLQREDVRLVRSNYLHDSYDYTSD